MSNEKGFTPLEISSMSKKTLQQPKKTVIPPRRDDLSLTGFTLVEIALAMVILTVGILALVATITPSLYLEQTSREFDLAKTAAINKLQEIRGYTFSDVSNHYNISPYNSFAVTGLTPPTANHGSIIINNSNPELLDITVTITWQSGVNSNTNLSLSMKTMLARAN